MSKLGKLVSLPEHEHELKRHTVVYSESYNPEKDRGFYDHQIFAKTSEQKTRVIQCIQNCVLFKHLERESLEKIVEAMVEKSVEPQEIVIKQGDEGNYFYVIDFGVFEAFVIENGNEVITNVYENEGSFGELALMYNRPRAATVRARTAGKLWAMQRQTFRKIMVQSNFEKRKLYEKFIETVPMLKPLELFERMALADCLVPKYYKNGDFIIKQGDEANGMYFVEKGEVRVTMCEQQIKEISILGPGNYFGELALVTKKPRAATIIAIGEVKVAFLDVETFERLLGPCMDIMRRHIELYDIQVQHIFGKNLEDARFAREKSFRKLKK